MAHATTTFQSVPTSTSIGNLRSISIAWFAINTLLGAFLGFQVQPMISKSVLPWFGGTPAVWTTCMLFFQILLFGGYLYAHFLRTFLRPMHQAIVHLALLLAAVMALPIEPNDSWKPIGNELPTFYLLTLLAAHVGLPYFVLSSTGPLVQAWMSYRDDRSNVYRLYALSNIGSLAALVSYPFLVEPWLSVGSQSTCWSVLFCLYVVVQGVVAVALVRSDAMGDCVERLDRRESYLPPTIWTRTAWLVLPALGSTMLLVVTGHVCQDVAVVPFLWVLPLAIYLVSFIISFDSSSWYKPKLVAALTILSIGCIHGQTLLPAELELIGTVVAFMSLLFGICLLCHGEVARLRPGTAKLTEYYAMLSAGGAIGGIFVAVVCPLLFSSMTELPVSLVVVQTLAFVVFVASTHWKSAVYDWSRAYRFRYVAAILFFATLIGSLSGRDQQTIASERNFFGMLRVLKDEQGLKLVHGTTIHGMQRSGDHADEPTTYYGRQSGVGLAITELQKRTPSLQLGVVGLGCGVLAAYGRPSDAWDFIEINPSVVSIADRHFSFLSDCPSEIRHHLGDGRLVLERRVDDRFDLLILDAFSSDAIPAHLLTREAVRLYRERLSDHGVLAFHVSNTHLNLVPLVHRLANDAGLVSREVRSAGDESIATKPAIWVLASTRTSPFWDFDGLVTATPPNDQQLSEAPLWTDQHHNLLSVLQLRRPQNP